MFIPALGTGGQSVSSKSHSLENVYGWLYQ